MLESQLCFWASAFFAVVAFVMTFIWWVRGIQPRAIWTAVQVEYVVFTYLAFFAGLIFTALGS